jgi:SAM-dependent methyltransferase
MSEERRAVPVPKPLDSDAAPTVPDLDSPNSSRPDAAASLSNNVDAAALRPGQSEPPVGARKRSRLALRIPDDEVARPQPLVALDRPHGDTSAADSLALDDAPPKVGDVPSHVDTAPAGAGDVPSPRSTPPDSTIVPGRIITINPPPPTPAIFESPTPMPPEAETVSDGDDAQLEADALPLVTPRIATARVVVPTPPPAALTVQPDVSSVVTPRVVATPPTVPPEVSPEGEARPDPSDGEISPDDLVAIDATPAAPEIAVGLPPVRRRLPSQPPTPPPASKKAGATPPAPRPSKPPLVIVPPHMGSVAPQQPEGSGLRRKGRFWWEELFNDDYLRAAERMTDQQLVREVDFIEQSLAIERGGAMLDLACGTGRHAVELARRGYQVVGFDLSLAMLARASDEAQERRTKLNFVQGDMREMTFAEQFDGVYCWNTSFGYFEEEKNALVVDRIRSALKGGGLFLLDVVNRDFLVQQSPSLVWFEGDGCVCMDEMVVDFITSRMRIKRTMMLDDGRSREIEYSMRIYSLHELGKMLHDHGFKVCEVSGRTATPGVFLGHESPRTIILAEKR